LPFVRSGKKFQHLTNANQRAKTEIKNKRFKLGKAEQTGRFRSKKEIFCTVAKRRRNFQFKKFLMGLALAIPANTAAAISVSVASINSVC